MKRGVSTPFLNYLRDIEELPLLVILDYNMPHMNAQDLLIHMKAEERFMPIKVFILSTGMNKKLKQQLVSLGANCCVAKPNTTAGYNALANDIIKFAHSLKSK